MFFRYFLLTVFCLFLIGCLKVGRPAASSKEKDEELVSLDSNSVDFDDQTDEIFAEEELANLDEFLGITDEPLHLEGDEVSEEVSLFSTSSTAKTLNVYVSPKGKDSNSGLSMGRAVKTLSKAHSIVHQRKPTKTVNIWIDRGTYYHQSLYWTYNKKGLRINIKRRFSNSRPVFDGCKKGTTCLARGWFSSSKIQGRYSYISISGLEVKNYWHAINFSSDKSNPSKYSGGNKVQNMVFRNIGNVINKKLRWAYSAITLANSRNNVISGNYFSNIVNDSKSRTVQRYMHAVYMAHHANYNEIYNNRFYKVSGDAVKVRNRCNHNRIYENNFDKAGRNGYYDVFCDKNVKSCAIRECPSYNNRFYRNALNKPYNSKDKISVSYIHQKDKIKGCSNIPSKYKRAKVYDNATSCGLNDCVNSKGKCYREGTGSPHLLCSRSDWHVCGLGAVGKTISGVTCTKVSSKDAVWKFKKKKKSSKKNKKKRSTSSGSSSRSAEPPSYYDDYDESN